jgi:hypothetical protein
MRDRKNHFAYLGAPQLLKHAVGIKRRYSDGGLILVWYDTDTSEAQQLAGEI